MVHRILDVANTKELGVGVYIRRHMFAVVGIDGLAPSALKCGKGEYFCIQSLWIGARGDIAHIVVTPRLEYGSHLVDHLWVDQRAVGRNANDGVRPNGPSRLVITVQDVAFASTKTWNACL